MKNSQKAVSIAFLFLLAIIVLAVLAFFAFSLRNLVSCSPVLQEQHAVKFELNNSSFFSHDVLKVAYYCEMDEKWPYYYSSLYEKDCFDASNYEWDNKLLENAFHFNKILLINENLDYRIVLDEKMSIFQEIKKKIDIHDDYFKKILARRDERSRFSNPMELQAIFDRKNPEIIYVLFSFNDQIYWGPNEWAEISETFDPNVDKELVAYSGEIAIYKYNLSTDNLELLYNAYNIVDNELEEKLVLNKEGLIAPADLIGIDAENNLMISGSRYYGMTGLGGGDITFKFEGLSAWHDFYLLKVGSTELQEYKYTEDNNSYNADLYKFLMFDYYPQYFDMDEFIGTEIYKEF